MLKNEWKDFGKRVVKEAKRGDLIMFAAEALQVLAICIACAFNMSMLLSLEIILIRYRLLLSLLVVDNKMLK